MSLDVSINESDLVRECVNSPFEILVLNAFKEISRSIKSLEERISFLENKMILEK